MKQIIKDIAMLLFLASFIIAFVGLIGPFVGLYPESESYQYDIKTEQVYDTQWVEHNDVTHFDDLSADEQQLLHDAFQKEHELIFGTGSASVSLHYQDERLDTFTDWRTIEVNGVLLVVAVSESVEAHPDASQFEWQHWVLVGGMIYFVLGWLYLLLIPPDPY